MPPATVERGGSAPHRGKKVELDQGRGIRTALLLPAGSDGWVGQGSAGASKHMVWGWAMRESWWAD